MADFARTLYDEDYHAWALGQAAALRRLAERRWNGPLDLENLAEEVEDLAKAELHTVLSQIERIVGHALKLEHSRAQEPRRGWILSIVDARRELGRRLTRTLRRSATEEFEHLYAGERPRAAPSRRVRSRSGAAGYMPLHA